MANLWVINHYAVPPTEYGGTRHYSLAKALANRGHRVAIIAADFHHNSSSRVQKAKAAASSDATVSFDWVPVPAYRGNGLGRLWNMLVFAWRVSRIRRDDQPSVILGSSPHPFAALAALRLARRHRVPFILEVRDLWPDSLVSVAGAPRWHPLVLILSAIERHLYSSANAIVSLLPNAAEHIAQRGGVRDRIVWIPNGVDLGVAQEPTSPKQEDETFEVCYAGTHGQANALESIIEAARKLEKRRSPSVRLRLIGEGPEKARLMELVQRNGPANVVFEPAVPKADIYQKLAAADALIATTRDIPLYAHGLSFNKLFDYLAAGRPIVFGARSPGNPVEQSGAGIVVPPENAAAMADAIETIVRLTVAERQDLGARGRAYAESQYDIKTLAIRLEDVLREVIDGAAQNDRPVKGSSK